MNVNTLAPRSLRKRLVENLKPHTQIGREEFTLYLLSPAQVGDGTSWRYAVYHNNEFVVIGYDEPTREAGRQQAELRFGVKAQEVRPPRQNKLVA